MKHGPSFTQLLPTQATSVLKIENTFRRVLLEMLPHCTICQGIRYSSFLKPFFLLKGKHYEKNMNPAFASPVSQTNSLARFLEWPECFFSGCLRHFFRRFVFVFFHVFWHQWFSASSSQFYPWSVSMEKHFGRQFWLLFSHQGFIKPVAKKETLRTLVSLAPLRSQPTSNATVWYYCYNLMMEPTIRSKRASMK